MNTRVHKLFARDMRVGIFARYKQWIIVCGIMAFLCILEIGNMEIESNRKCTMVDLITNILFADTNSISMIPKEWIVFWATYIMSIMYFPSKDLDTMAEALMLRAGNKKDWWFSKAFWLIVDTIIFYLLFIVNCFVVAIASSGHWKEQLELHSYHTLYNIPTIDCQFYIWIFLMPLLVLIAVGILQMLISCLSSIAIGVSVSLVALVLPVYGSKTLFITSYCMLAKTPLYNDDSELTLRLGIMLCLGVVIGSILIGKIYFSKMEMLSRR